MAPSACSPWPLVGPSYYGPATRSLSGRADIDPVAATDLTKHFGSFAAVSGIDFNIQQGETFALLGPNGAGKSSTMKMVSTVSPITSGSLSVLGRDPASDGREIRQRLGVVPQEDNLDSELSVRENLVLYARYYGLSWTEARSRADELLDFAQLADRADAKVEPLSGGMKRRLTIARALVNTPELVLLDEPTTGLDPQARHLLWERLYRLKEDGVTLLLTTHYMDEAEQLADRLVIMDEGKIAAAGTPSELIATHVSREVLEIRPVGGKPVDLEGFEHETLADRVLLYVDDAEAALGQLHAAGVNLESSLIRRATLEDVFLALTGRRLVD